MDRRGERLCPKQNCAGYKGSSMTLEGEESHGSFRRQIFFPLPRGDVSTVDGEFHFV